MNCINCNKETDNPKFCSRSCAAIFTNRIPKRKRKSCAKCDKITKSFRHTLCEEHWQEFKNSKLEAYQDKPLLEYWSKDSLKALHTSSKNVYVRNHARSIHKNLLTKPCAKCGYDKHVELCHIKGISEFKETDLLREVNDLSNVIQLCPNCHWELDHNHWSEEEKEILNKSRE